MHIRIQACSMLFLIILVSQNFLVSHQAQASGVPINHASSAHEAVTISPTLAFLSNPKLLQSVRSKFGTLIEQYTASLIVPVLHNEVRLGATHVPFYHGQQIVHRVYQDILAGVYKALGNTMPEDFVFLRFWQAGVSQKTAQEFIDAQEGGKGYSWDDGEPNLAKNILSTTYSLFGNVTGGSCAFEYYVGNRNNVSYSLADLLRPLFDHYGFDRTYIKRFESTHESLQTKVGGTFCQIFIPKAIVDQCVYISQPGGTPQRNAIDGIMGFDNTKLRYTQISPFLRFLCAHPSHVQQRIEGTQARIVFIPETLDFRSGVKIFRYAQIEPDVLTSYQDTIMRICQEMVADMKHSKHGR